jgi:hypothetical protein
MWPVSDAYKATMLKSDQRAAYKIEALLNGAVLYSTTAITATGPTPDQGFLISGSVAVDITASARRRLDIELVDPNNEIAPLLDIFGQEVRIYRGLYVPDASGAMVPEYVPLVTSRLTDVEKVESPALTVKLRGSDRSLAISQQLFIDPWVIAAGTNYGQAIQDILRSRIPWLTFSPTDFSTVTSLTTPALTFAEGTSPWTACTNMASACGLDTYFNPMGTSILVPSASLTAGPVVWSFIEGVNNTAITIGDRDSSTAAVSACVVSGEGTGLAPGVVPPRAVVYDTDPTSTTYYLGPFGIVPNFLRTPLATTQQQCLDSATARLQLFSGRAQRLEITCVPITPLEGSDNIHAVSKTIDATHLAENFTIPMSPKQAMTIGSRKKLTLR